jgi:ATP-dependent Clp protease ATP-binding subunit ClpC
LFECEDVLVWFDMSEYSEPHAVARIVGAPPGYVGHEHGGALTDPLLRRPHQVVLLDEIEKAHRDVHQLLLQVLDEGRLTDGRGRTIDFRHAAILMTSNLGAELVMHGRHAKIDETAVLARARAAFPVELWNRIEAPLVLQPLGREELRRICRRLARSSSDRLQRERGVRFELAPAACERLVDRAGADPTLGARPLRHLVTREIDPLVADAVLRGTVRAGQALLVDVAGDRFVLR